jgi:nucleotide-binding universal stress UspA family protein
MSVSADDMAGKAKTGRIVVGVDGSAEARRALAWAARQAEITGAGLEVVLAWEMPAMLFGPVVWPEGYDPKADAGQLVDAEIEAVLGANPDIPISAVVEEGQAAAVLQRAAGGADLLVVGSRGRGGFTGLVIGSVSEHLAAHAPCPIVIIH